MRIVIDATIMTHNRHIFVSSKIIYQILQFNNHLCHLKYLHEIISQFKLPNILYFLQAK